MARTGAVVCLLALLVCLLATFAQASSPPMGWSSWDGFNDTLTEQLLNSTVSTMINTQMLAAGFTYVVVDSDWFFDPVAQTYVLDGQSRVLPAAVNWPSASGLLGFAPLSGMLEQQGLKLGIRIVRGINIQAVTQNQPIAGTPYFAQDIAVASDACAWDPDWLGVNMSHPAGAAYYQSLVEQYTNWGIRYLMVDCVFGADEHILDLEAINASLTNLHNNAIFLTASPGTNVTKDQATTAVATMGHHSSYRISPSLWDCWNTTGESPHCASDIFPFMAEFASFATNDSCSIPDLGSLPIAPRNGVLSQLNQTQQQALIGAWAVFRSPIFVGGDITQPNALNFTMITNPKLWKVSQKGVNVTMVWFDSTNSTMVFHSQDADNYYFALTNFGSGQSATFSVDLKSAISLSMCRVTDVWSDESISPATNVLTLTIPPQSGMLVRVDQCLPEISEGEAIIIVATVLGVVVVVVLIIFVLSKSGRIYRWFRPARTSAASVDDASPLLRP
jgi:hypothetical protein